MIGLKLQYITKPILTNEDYREFLKYLNTLADDKYRRFNEKLVPGREKILGVRVPVMRRLAKEIAYLGGEEYLRIPKGDIQEEIVLHGLVIGCSKLSFEDMRDKIREYAKMVDNWANCDVPVSSFKSIQKRREEYKPEVVRFIKSENMWERRVGYVILLDHYLVEEYIDFVLDCLDGAADGEYYVQMAAAWLLATCAAKFEEKTVDFARERSIGREIFKLFIKKCRESYRVSGEVVDELNKIYSDKYN